MTYKWLAIYLVIFLISATNEPENRETSVQSRFSGISKICRVPNNINEGTDTPKIDAVVNLYCPPAEKNTINLPYSDWEENRELYMRNYASEKFKDDGNLGANERKFSYIILHSNEESFLDSLSIYTYGLPQRTIDSDLSYSSLNDFRTIRRRIAAFSSVSIHYLIAQDGTVVRNILDKDVAYHSGRSDIDKASIGIDIVAMGINPQQDKKNAHNMTKIQEKKLLKLLKYLQEKYQISTENILPHRFVSGSDCPKSFFPIVNGRDSFWAWRDENLLAKEVIKYESRVKQIIDDLPPVPDPGVNPPLPGAAIMLNIPANQQKATQALEALNNAAGSKACLAKGNCVDWHGHPNFMFDKLGQRISGLERQVVSYLYCDTTSMIILCQNGCVKSPGFGGDHCFHTTKPEDVIVVDLFSSDDASVTK